ALRRYQLFVEPRAPQGLSADVVAPTSEDETPEQKTEPEPVAEAPPPPAEPPAPEPEPISKPEPPEPVLA
ncbi:hypothetical protein ACSTHB_23485, partial [Vibrio parahaemolyticus]